VYAALQQHCRENERYARDECTGHCLDEIHIFSGRVVSNAATSDRLSLSNNARASKTRSLEKRPFAVISIDGFFRKKNKRFVLSSAILPSILRIIEIRRNTPVEFVYVQFYIPFEFTVTFSSTFLIPISENGHETAFSVIFSLRLYSFVTSHGIGNFRNARGFGFACVISND